jgi:CubicO group peptidase (beta-lactamase class C family)
VTSDPVSEAILRAILAGAILLSCAAGRPIAAQLPANLEEKVDALVRAEMQRQRIPGLSLGVYRDGKIAKAEGYGLADLEWDAAVKPDTLFQSGSVGKQFTATAIMMLVEQGKVGLDDSIQKYFPGSPESWKNIRVRNLLTHTSGLAEYESEQRGKADGPFYLRLDFTEEQLYKKIAELPIDFKPGEKWGYRNTNYVLLGFLIHRVTGKFYGDFLKDRIFTPLGMKSTRIISDADIISRRASGYEMVDGQLKNQQWVSPTFNSTADGAMYFNIPDLEKWDAALYGEELLKRASLDQMWTPVMLESGSRYPYGFGWRVVEVNGHRLLEHGGAWQGFTTAICRYVNDRLTVVVLTNLDSEHSDPGRIAHEVARLYVPDLKLRAIADTEPRVTALLRTTLTDLSEGHLNLDSFAAASRQGWSPERSKRLEERIKSLGGLLAIGPTRTRTEDAGAWSYQYLVEFAQGSEVVNLLLDKTGEINGLDIHTE